ncbi:MAG: DUF5115 domain-containing protein [Bacteroidales bacterium]|nr:DUF5115 domain-containing protein [Bacteroidales bacterium]
MKRFSLYAGLAAVVLGLSACTEDYKNWAAPQSNAQQDALPTVTAVIGNGTDAAVVYNDAADDLNVAVYQGASDENVSDVKFSQALLNGTYEVAFTQDGNNINLSKADLDAAVRQLTNSRAYIDNALTFSLKGAAVDGEGQAVRVETNAIDFTYRPIPTPDVEEEYYLVGGFNNWNLSPSGSIKMEAKGNGVFEAVVNDVPENCYWKVFGKAAVEAADWDYGFGHDGSDYKELSGLVNWFEELGHQTDGLLIEAGGNYRFTFDAVNMTYSVTPAVTELYVPGNGNGWKPESAPMLCITGDGSIQGFAYIDGEFKFTLARNWSDGELNWTNFTSVPEGYAKGDGDGNTNIKPADSGYFFLKVNVAGKSLEATKTEWGIIGPAQAGGWGEDTDMTFDAENECWTATLALAADEFKFRANDAWDINVGGAADDLQPDGGNLRIDEAGTYTVKLYLSRKSGDKYYCTIEKQ